MEKKSVQIDKEDWEFLKLQSTNNQSSLNKEISSMILSERPCVYKLKLNDGKYYIGSTKNLIKRIQNHKQNKSFDDIEILYFNTIHEARNMERQMIIETDNLINKSNISIIFDISEMSIFYGILLYQYIVGKYNLQIAITNNFYFRLADIENIFLLKDKNINLHQMLKNENVKSFIDDIAKKDNIDINDVVISNRGDVGSYIHPLLAFDLFINNDINAKIDLFSFIISK